MSQKGKNTGFDKTQHVIHHRGKGKSYREIARLLFADTTKKAASKFGNKVSNLLSVKNLLLHVIVRKKRFILYTQIKSPPLIQSNKQILLRPNISMYNTLYLFQSSCPIRSFHTSVSFLFSVLFEREGNFPARNRKKEGTEDPHGMFPLIHDPLNISTHISLLFSSQTNFTTLHRGGEQVTTASTASHRYIQERIRRNEFRMRERERERGSG